MKLQRVWLAVILAVVSTAFYACAHPADSVVMIVAEGPTPPALIKIFGKNFPKTLVSQGTGFAANGKIYTCCHVIQDSTEITVTLRNGTIEKAKITGSDKDSDLAELSVDKMPPGLQIRHRAPHFPERVTQIGHPSGIASIVIVDGGFLTFDREQNLFLLDTASGNSGSPIIDRNGLVIGMTHTIKAGTRFTGGGTLSALRHFIYPDEPN